MLDDIDKTQIGRYGTISLLKRQDPSTVITSFGIDVEELTFGHDRDCGVRLYYADIDPIHCKIVFEDRKAFLVVLGKNGLLVDGCLVYPNPTAHGAQTTIPLTNNSEIEIHNKRFRFTYPPKELRAMLFSSPIRPNRAPRLSMIRSAQVFSPIPSKNPEENLRLLQSPLKSTFLRSLHKGSNYRYSGSRSMSTSPTKSTYYHVSGHGAVSDDELECEEIVLVEGDRPCVVEEEKDLVILEDVEVPPPSSSFTSAFSPDHPDHHLHPSIIDPPQTPRRRPNSRDSLHRAVLIRSAQRAVVHAEKENDELEEMEVLSVVASDDDDAVGQGDLEEVENGGDANIWNEVPTSREVSESILQDVERVQASQDLSLAAGSAEQGQLLLLHLSGNPEWKQGGINEDHGDDIHGSESVGLTSHSHSNDNRKHIGGFRTPQPQSRWQFQKPLGRSLFGFEKARSGHAALEPDNSTNGSSRRARYSIASSEPRRMLVEMPWRVEDLVVPTKSEEHHAVDAANDTTREMPLFDPDSQLHTVQFVTSSSERKRVDERERKAIRERRRSALRDMDSFFAGAIPGMGLTPTKKPVSPYHQSRGSNDTPKGSLIASQEENTTTPRPSKNSGPSIIKKEEDEELDTKSLLEKMKVTVEEMKRRRSTMFTPPSLVRQTESILLNDSAAIEAESSHILMQEENSGNGHSIDQTEKHQSFSLLRLPKVVFDPPQNENENCSMEKSFSQLMRSESPDDLEQPSDDIRNILEQDITIPSERPLHEEYAVHDSTDNNLYTTCRSTRSRTRTVSAEQETNLSTYERGKAHGTKHTEQPHLVASGCSARDVRNGRGRARAVAYPSAQSGGRNPPKRERNATFESQIQSSDTEEEGVLSKEIDTSEEEEDKRELTPTPAPRALRASRRGHIIASSTRQWKDKAEDVEKGPSDTPNHQSKGSTTANPGSDAKGRSRKVKGEDKSSSEGAEVRKTRTRSATVSGGASKTMGASKAPTTRSGGRKTPTTTTSAIPVNGEDEKLNGDKENSRNSKVVPADGTRIRISRNRATSNSAGRVKTEVTAAQRVTRTRTRART